jgi:chromosome partitioning protein
MMTHVIAVANEKGGVAKTTTVASLAGALVAGGQDVLVIDLDAQANLTMALGINPSSLRRSISDVLLNAVTPISASRGTSIPGLDIIPASEEMIMAERFLSIRHKYQWLLRNAISNLRSYDFILLDCPPSLGAVTTNALTAAHTLIIPTQAEYFSVHALKSTISAVQRIRKQTNAQLDYRLLITMLDIRNRIHKSLAVQLQDNFRGRIFDTVIGIDTKLRESSVAGLPITHYHAKCRSASQYGALTQEIVRNVYEKTAQPA